MPLGLHQISTWLVLVVALFAAVPPAQGMVICFGDGHVAFGGLGDRCPCDNGEDHDVDEHGPCNDVVVDPLNTALDGAISRVAVDVTCAPALPPFAALIAPQCVSEVVPRATLTPPDTGPRRSVVLLI